ncbi:hypothetical protein ACFWA6_07145 [Streptomyces sp. NPDC060020]|uniref:hypothetical protein n=1 Tax=Streptomyces sp. NPDC060020 TaxID=3347038 RepID=UPI0036BD9954
MVARWKHPLPLSPPGGNPHAYQRRPRPDLPPLRLQRPPAPPARHPLPPPAPRQPARHLELRRRRPHHRTTVRRGGFPTQDAAELALARFLEGEAGGYNADPSRTVAAYLDTWLEAKALVLKLKLTTMALEETRSSSWV